MLPDCRAAPLAAARPPGGPVLKAKAYQQFMEGESLLAQARAEVESMKESAAQACVEAKREGLRQGLARARRVEARRHFQIAAKATDYLAALEDRLIAMADEAIRLVAGQLPQAEINWQLIRRALARYRNLPDLTLRVPAAEEAAVRAQIAELRRAGTQALPGLRIEGDARLEVGNCFLESPLGKVNIGLTSQLTVLCQALANSGEDVLALDAAAPPPLHPARTP